MKIFSRLAAALLILAGGSMLAACDDQSPQQQSQQQQQQAAAATSGPTIWPPVPSGPVELKDEPTATNYLVVLDDSGSMDERECSGNETKFRVAQKALKEFATTISPNDYLALATLNRNGLIVDFGRGTTHRQRFAEAVDRLRASGGTPLVSAMQSGYAVLTEQAQRQRGYGTYRLVPITDGASGDGNPGPVAKNIVIGSAIEVHAIGFCTGSGHSLNVQGFTHFYTADNPRQLAEGLAAVRAEAPVFDPTSFDGR